MKVKLCGQLVSVVRNKMTWRHPLLVVNDAADKLVLKLQGRKKFCSVECGFKVFSAARDEIGEIQYTIHRDGEVTRACAELSFPRELDVRYKAALIGAAILNDYLDQ